ncbi:MAG: L,D-transpeptidase/peptidoglycan binding protein [Propionibacteriaceae bacterium]|jgi:lipoprotein-anchoring transpeptidase ErfK/SrfK|nr:L,D-transpeptidase/peptidoglycan binding protein [Propionibacteriaceae bacterium]
MPNGLTRPPIAPPILALPRHLGDGAPQRATTPRPGGGPGRNLVWLMGLVLAVLLVGGGFFYATLTLSRSSVAASGVMVGGVDVGGSSTDQLTRVITALAAEARLDLSYEDQTRQASLADLGVTVDTAATVEAALKADPGASRLAGNVAWAKQNVPLRLTWDNWTAKTWLSQHFAVGAVEPKAAQVGFDADAGSFTVTLGRSGWVFDLEPVKAAVTVLAADPGRSVACAVKLAPEAAPISDQAAVAAAERANRNLGLTLRFSTAAGAAYTATPADIADWTLLVPDTTTDRIDVFYDAADLETRLERLLSSQLARDGTPRRLIVDADGQTLGQADPGTPGTTVGELGELASTLSQLLGQGLGADLVAPTVTAELTTVTTRLSGPPPAQGQWIDVDLTTQVTTLFQDGGFVAAFLISSGLSETPTPPGTYQVYAKIALQTMSGRNADGTAYSIPDVPWATWFWGDYGFHAAYWLDESQIGQPQSHGCVNMRLDDAKFVFDWAAIGTTVVVHGQNPG